MALQNAPKAPPYRSPVTDENNVITTPWENYFKYIYESLSRTGEEKVFQIVNNTAVAADITALSFDARYTSLGIIEYVIQRVTTSVELIQTGTIHAVYRPTAKTWALVNIGSPGPDVSGVTLAITAAGKIQYTSTSAAGTQSISRIVYRIREFAGKSYVYSKVGS